MRYVWRDTCNINSVDLNFFISEDRVGQFHFNIPNTARQRIRSDLRYFFEVFLCWLAGFVVSDLHLNVGYNDHMYTDIHEKPIIFCRPPSNSVLL